MILKLDKKHSGFIIDSAQKQTLKSGKTIVSTGYRQDRHSGVIITFTNVPVRLPEQIYHLHIYQAKLIMCSSIRLCTCYKLLFMIPDSKVIVIYHCRLLHA